MNTKNTLYESAKNYLDEERKLILDKALKISTEYSKNEQNKLGINFLQESIDVAVITTTEIGLGLSAMISVLLFRVYESKKIDKKFLLTQFPENFALQISGILDGLIEANKLNSERVFGLQEINFEEKYESLSKRSKKFAKNQQEYLTEQGEYFKHFFITIGEDVRVVLLKLAYHLYKMRNIDKYNNEKIEITCREARFLYAPMAHQLGLYNIKTFLEEMAMKYLNSDIYRDIAKKLSETKASRDQYIIDFIKPIQSSIDELGYKTTIKGRPKSIHSIWNKIKQQDVGLEKIYDLFAIRVILKDDFQDIKEEKSACWNVYSKITDIWLPNPNRLRDWVSAPKASGYESLHTTVIGPDGKWVEVQIRTQRMDDIAEKGNAAHWRYKEVKGQTNHNSWLDELSEILENPENENINNVTEKAELYSDTIYVFTPKGEVKKFNAGATVLDFAYKIHSNVGNQCTGAKIKGKLVGIRHKLSNGDVIEILTSNNQTPKFEWLDIVVSSAAKTRIKRALKEFEKEHIEEGKHILADIVNKVKTKYNKSDFELDDKKLNQLRKKFSVSKLDDFYIKLQKQEINITTKFLYENYISPDELNYENALEKLKSNIEEEQIADSKITDYLIIDKNMSGIKYEFSKCCNPIPGDNVFAFITATKGTKIHKINCPNAPVLFKKYSYRIMKAAWKQNEVDSKFKVRLKIISEQKPGIVNQISSIIIKQQFVDLYGINIEESHKETFEGTIGILVTGTKYVAELIKKLKAIPGIMSVTRVDKI
ncbi:MAG: bifunctional (p)ppGpp synthetase/guanosine-3',5'-bis(diphosphate) 3'-pyrophosphohydrolase [Bacteroidales bacterium]|nr:bifunctional (p)ppGpp synthetase/guanosine-3',5'-bis(diphosphate) 3'-pyrophosphohydrolase [Bacteroidales bacterium]